MPMFYVPNPTYEPCKASKDLEYYINLTMERLNDELTLSTSRNSLHSSFQICFKSLRLSLDDIIILRADKGLGLVVVLRSDYSTWMLDHLWNDQVYRGVASLPVIAEKYVELETILVTAGLMLDSDIAKYILQDNTGKVNWGHLYFLVKIHKKDISPPPLRPICSQLRTVSYYASKYVSKILAPLVKEHVHTYFDDSLHIIEYLTVTEFHQPVVLCAADISNLYPSIDITDVLLKLELFLRSFRSLDLDLIMTLVQFILYNNYFEIDGLFFRQVSGVAMGTPCAVMISVIYVHMLETATSLAIDPQSKPLYLVRYIDDFFGIFLTVADAQNFFLCFNTQNTNIKVPIEELQLSYCDYNCGVNFLDFTVQQVLGDPKLVLKLYQKPFHLSHHQYIHFYSRHQHHVKSSFIRSELNRIFLRCSLLHDCISQFELFYNTLVSRGYPTSFLDVLFQKHIVYSSPVDYEGKRLYYISCRLISKYNRQVTLRPLVYKKRYGSVLPFKRILSTDCIRWAPSFLPVFQERDPVVVTYGQKRLGSAVLNKRPKLF